jgi:hypothetical protein
MPPEPRVVGFVTLSGHRRLGEVSLTRDQIEVRGIYPAAHRLRPLLIRPLSNIVIARSAKLRWSPFSRLWVFPAVEVVFEDGLLLLVESPRAERLLNAVNANK